MEVLQAISFFWIFMTVMLSGPIDGTYSEKRAELIKISFVSSIICLFITSIYLH